MKKLFTVKKSSKKDIEYYVQILFSLVQVLKLTNQRAEHFSSLCSDWLVLGHALMKMIVARSTRTPLNGKLLALLFWPSN